MATKVLSVWMRSIRRTRQNQAVLQLRDELLAECGGGLEATAKEKLLIEARGRVCLTAGVRV